MSEIIKLVVSFAAVFMAAGAWLIVFITHGSWDERVVSKREQAGHIKIARWTTIIAIVVLVIIYMK